MLDLLNVIQNQKTTRRSEFNSKTVPDEIIEAIKKSIVNSANASNRQSYSVIVLDSEKAKELNLPGSKVFIFCIDFNRLKLSADFINCDFNNQYFMQFTTALIDISILAQSAILVSQSLGLSTLLTNEIYHKHLDKVFKILNLPNKYVFPMIALSLGYSDIKKEKKERLPNKFVFHENCYKNYYEWFFNRWSKTVGTEKESDYLFQKLKEHNII